jgi:LysM repeat protein
MAGRSPARFLAPIALIAFAIVLYQVVQGAGGPAGGTSGTPASATPAASGTKKSSSASKKSSSAKKRKTYTVKAGDTPSGIAQKTGVALSKLQALNPNLDPQTLAPGQRIRLQ